MTFLKGYPSINMFFLRLIKISTDYLKMSETKVKEHFFHSKNVNNSFGSNNLKQAPLVALDHYWLLKQLIPANK